MKIAITARNFSTGDDSAVRLLQAAGHTIIDLSEADMGAGTPESAVWEAVQDAEIAIAGLEPYSRAVLEHCPSLRLISRRGIGYDSVDLDACKDHQVAVCRTVGAVEGSVAEHVLAYILYFARRVDLQNIPMHEGKWQRIMTPGAKTRRLGLVGFGGIGKEIALRARPFGMELYYTCRHPNAAWEQEYGVKYLPMDELLATCDYVSANVPLTEATRNMFDAAAFAKMKPGSIFINIARGPVADVHALRAALDSGHLAGAAIDVYDREPCTDSPLIGHPNALLTPHSASYTSENFTTMNVMAAQNVLDFLEGALDAKFLV